MAEAGIDMLHQHCLPLICQLVVTSHLVVPPPHASIVDFIFHLHRLVVASHLVVLPPPPVLCQHRPLPPGTPVRGGGRRCPPPSAAATQRWAALVATCCCGRLRQLRCRGDYDGSGLPHCRRRLFDFIHGWKSWKIEYGLWLALQLVWCWCHQVILKYNIRFYIVEIM